jgi:uncharacterized membrane protein YhaH (DUF805 family)
MELVKKCFVHYVDFKGRARRKEYWSFWLFSLLLGFVTASLDHVLGTGRVINTLSTLALFLPGLAVAVRRMHDVNKSGWYVGGVYLAIFLTAGTGFIASEDHSIPFGVISAIAGLLLLVYVIYYICALCRKGDLGANRFGEDPKTSVVA